MLAYTNKLLGVLILNMSMSMSLVAVKSLYDCMSPFKGANLPKLVRLPDATNVLTIENPGGVRFPVK